MGTTYRKVKYNDVGNYGSTDVKTLYCGYNRSCDVTTIYDEDGSVLFSFDDTLDNNLFDAITKLCNNESVEKVSHEEFSKIFGNNKISS